MASFSSPTVQRRRLAAALKQLRGNRTGGEVAHGIHWSTSKISRAESGRENLPPAEIEKLVDFYDVTDPLRSRLLELAEDAVQPGWWEEYAAAVVPEFGEFIGLEAGSSSCRTWQSDLVPGLLQTEGYARQIDAAYQLVDPATPPKTREQFLRVRQIRQERLTREPVLRLSFVVDESVLLRGIGDDVVMRAQLAHLVDVSALPNIDLRVLRLRQNNALGGVASFTIISFDPAEGVPGGALEDVVNAEGLAKDLTVEGEQDTHLFGLFFNALSNAALSPDDSRDLIVTTIRDVWS